MLLIYFPTYSSKVIMLSFTGALVIANTKADDFDDSITIVATIALLAGLFQLICAILHVGKFAWILSDILVSSFTCAAAVHVAVSQLDSLFGLELEKYSGVLTIPYVSSNSNIGRQFFMPF